ncbi:MAG: PIG-L family deacetylase [Acidobacteria bacterium]|nr:PIG-L family deacetylase [Acidobacteriota bacterium]
MNILAIGAHPDDIEFGCGGSLIKYRKKGCDIYLLILTLGELGGDPEVRRREQFEAKRIIGAKEVFFGGYRDTELTMSLPLIHKIEEVIERVKPSFIFVNYYEDTHQDHVALAKASLSATRYIRNVLFYEVPTTVNFSPNVFIDIKQTFEAKLASLEAHSSQITKTNVEGLSILDIARATAHFRGTQAKVQYAEGFVSLRLFINI